MIKLYGYWRSAATFRVRAALNLKGLAFEEIMVDLEAGEQEGPDYNAINPAAAVPTLIVDGGPPMTQSMAILGYLEEQHPEPALMPKDVYGRARVRALALFFTADYHPLIVPRVQQHLAEVFGAAPDQQAAWARYWLRKGLVLAEAKLAGEVETGAFCHGDEPSIADLCLMSQVLGAQGSGLSIADLPTIERIAKTCMSLDAFANAAPLRQPGAPAQP